MCMLKSIVSLICKRYIYIYWCMFLSYKTDCVFPAAKFEGIGVKLLQGKPSAHWDVSKHETHRAVMWPRSKQMLFSNTRGPATCNLYRSQCMLHCINKGDFFFPPYSFPFYLDSIKAGQMTSRCVRCVGLELHPTACTDPMVKEPRVTPTRMDTLDSGETLGNAKALK